jgi:uncharacterized protein YerC
MVVLTSSESESGKDQFEELFITVALLQDAGEARDFLGDIFTTKEIANAARRWCVIQRLIAGDTQVAAANTCHANKNTVSRANTAVIQQGARMSKIMRQRLENQRRGSE